MNEPSGYAGMLCIGGVVLGVLVLIARMIYSVCKMSSSREIACPECEGGTRRPWGPCQVCGPNDKINVGTNPIPRGTGHGGGDSAPAQASTKLDQTGY